jgi:hypothetical protein
MKRPDHQELAAALIRLGTGPGQYTERDLHLAVDDAARTARSWIGFLVARGHYIDWSDVGNAYTVCAELFKGYPELPMLQRYLGPISREENPDTEHVVRRFRAVVRKYTINWVKEYFRGRDKPGGRMRRVVLAEVRKQALREEGLRIHFAAPHPEKNEPITSWSHVDGLLRQCGPNAQVPDLIRATRALVHERVDAAAWIEVNQLVHDYLEFFAFRLLASISTESAGGVHEELTVQEWHVYWGEIRDGILGRLLERSERASQEEAELVFRAHEDWLKASIEAGKPLARAQFFDAYFPGMSEEAFRTSPFRRMMDWLRNETARHFLRRFGPGFGLAPS